MGGNRSGRPQQQTPSSATQSSVPPPSSTSSQPPRSSSSSTQSSSVPPPSSTSSQPPRSSSSSTQSPPQPQPQPVPPMILPLANVANTCYAVSTLQVLHSVDLQHQLLPGQTPLQMNLTNLLSPILNISAASPQTDLVNLVMALNMCLPPQSQFHVGQQQCAGEFLGSLLDSLTLQPHFSTFQVQAVCHVCRNTESSNLANSVTPLLLIIPILNSPVPADLSHLVTRILTQQGNFLSCQTVNCPARLAPIPTNVIFTDQTVSVYWLSRNISQGGRQIKSLTQVQDPGQTNWNGKQCTALLAHEGRVPGGGHWVAFLKASGVWWRVDSNRAGPNLENPFISQMNPNNPYGYTIDILFFT